jgi:hypothetical protein
MCKRSLKHVELGRLDVAYCSFLSPPLQELLQLAKLDELPMCTSAAGGVISTIPKSGIVAQKKEAQAGRRRRA